MEMVAWKGRLGMTRVAFKICVYEVLVESSWLSDRAGEEGD